MKCKVFTVHLQGQRTASDEASLNEFLQSVSVKRIFTSIVNDDGNSWSVLIFYEDGSQSSEQPHDSEIPSITLTPHEELDYEDLKRWRNDRASQDGIAPYMIASNNQLRQMVKLSVKTRDDLFLRIKGFGEKRIQKYGDEILQVLMGMVDEIK